MSFKLTQPTAPTAFEDAIQSVCLRDRAASVPLHLSRLSLARAAAATAEQGGYAHALLPALLVAGGEENKAIAYHVSVALGGHASVCVVRIYVGSLEAFNTLAR